MTAVAVVMMIAEPTLHTILVNNLRIFSNALETGDGKFLMRTLRRHVSKMNFSSGIKKKKNDGRGQTERTVNISHYFVIT